MLLLVNKIEFFVVDNLLSFTLEDDAKIPVFHLDIQFKNVVKIKNAAVHA